MKTLDRVKAVLEFVKAAEVLKQAMVDLEKSERDYLLDFVSKHVMALTEKPEKTSEWMDIDNARRFMGHTSPTSIYGVARRVETRKVKGRLQFNTAALKEYKAGLKG